MTDVALYTAIKSITNVMQTTGFNTGLEQLIFEKWKVGSEYPFDAIFQKLVSYKFFKQEEKQDFYFLIAADYRLEYDFQTKKIKRIR